MSQLSQNYVKLKFYFYYFKALLISLQLFLKFNYLDKWVGSIGEGTYHHAREPELIFRTYKEGQNSLLRVVLRPLQNFCVIIYLHTYKVKNIVLGDWSTGSTSKELLLFWSSQIQPGALRCRFTTVCNSSSRGSDVLFWPWGPGTNVIHRCACMWFIEVCADKTYIHI